MSKEELEGLSPEEKIEKLKEIEKKKKKEIAEAQELLKESENELSDKEEFKERVPIPEVAKEDLSTASEEEKEILKTHKGLDEKKDEDSDEKSSESKNSKENLGRSETAESLEEIAFREKAELPKEVIQSEYAAKLSLEPMENLYREMKDIYLAVEEKGYVSPEEERKIGYLSAATERKLEDIESGDYSLTEEVSKAAMLTKSIGASLRDTYQRGEGGRKLYQN